MRIVREQVSKQVYCKLHGKLRDQTKEQVRYRLSEQVSSEIYGIDEVHNNIYTQVRRQITLQLKQNI